jgi:hypothetical protein
MFLKRIRLSDQLAVGGLIVARSLFAYPAQASDVGRELDSGCSDAEGGSYDRNKHIEVYESGWQV